MYFEERIGNNFFLKKYIFFQIAVGQIIQRRLLIGRPDPGYIFIIGIVKNAYICIISFHHHLSFSWMNICFVNEKTSDTFHLIVAIIWKFNIRKPLVLLLNDCNLMDMWITQNLSCICVEMYFCSFAKKTDIIKPRRKKRESETIPRKITGKTLFNESVCFACWLFKLCYKLSRYFKTFFL